MYVPKIPLKDFADRTSQAALLSSRIRMASVWI